MQYQLTADPDTIKMTTDEGVIKFIPTNNPANTDSAAYLEWLAVPNTPDPE